MVKFKQYVGDQLKGHKLRFYCDCSFGMDVVGTIVDYDIIQGELILSVDVKGKIIKIGENHPGLEVERTS